MSAGEFGNLLATIDRELSLRAEKRERLRNLDLFVLDNSLRESTVGQIRGHTLENKWAILEQVKKCGFKNVIISAFSHMPRVDDEFVRMLSEKEPDMSNYFTFSEIGAGHRRGDLPVALKKMKQYKMRNPIFEIDLAGCTDDDRKQRLKALLRIRINYTYRSLASDAKILIKIRDLAPAMIRHPLYVFEVVKMLATMPENKRPFGIIFEEPTGRYLPEQLGAWTKSLRQLMDECDWKSAHLLVHIHKKWEMAEVAQLECLACGADGVWASVCEEGAALGHACSVVTIMNLIRMGNTKVLAKYNCTHLREAAIRVTEITTGQPPHPKQTIYGERALDTVFDPNSGMGAIAETKKYIDSPSNVVRDTDMSEFFKMKSQTRISTLASVTMVRDKLIELFGENEQFTEDMVAQMKAVMIEDLSADRKEEYMSHCGLAILFDRAGGKLTADMASAIQSVELKSAVHEQLLKEVRKIWDEWDISEEEVGDDCLEFYSFYNAFMSPYFGCYECEDSRKALQAIDMDVDGKVNWNEFCVYLKWALHQYPDVCTAAELVSVAFRKGLIPAMQDEILKTK